MVEIKLRGFDEHPEVGTEAMIFYENGGCKAFYYAVWDGQKWGICVSPDRELINLPEQNYIGWMPKDGFNVNDSTISAVNHPSHYNTGKFECRDVMIEVFGKEDYIAFCKLSAFKYVFRGGKKEGNSERQDLQKAVWYLNDVIELMKNEE